MSSEAQTVGSLALLYAFRMLGLFMVLPILVLYGNEYLGATPMLLGLALGIYGLTQAVFQIPLGLLSDIWGRKPIIVGGLLIFAVGSVIAALSDSVEGLILGRALQGSGAIASTIMAMVADLTSEENRTKAMAAIGASIGLSFTIALILGPALASMGGLGLIFTVSAVLAGVGIAIVTLLVPTPPRFGHSHRDSGAIPSLLLSTCSNLDLMRLNAGIFTLHFVLMASFVVVPVLLVDIVKLDRDSHWMVYLPTLIIAFIIMLPLMLAAEKKRKVKPVFIGAVSALAVSFCILIMNYQITELLLASVLVFFVAFNLLEAMLPSLVSKISPAGAKGTAMGLYSTSQFLGAFAGGLSGGWLMQNAGIEQVFWACFGLVCGWLMLAFTMSKPRHLNSLCIKVPKDVQDYQSLLKVDGVVEALLVVEESLLYLKVDRQLLDERELELVVAQL